MGHVKIDTERQARAYSQTYALNTASGVRAILRDRHVIGSRRFRGDTAASDIIIDLHSAIESAELSAHQAEVIAWLYGLDLTQETAARIMGISRPAVTQLCDAALERIAAVFSRWKYESVTVEADEGVAA